MAFPKDFVWGAASSAYQIEGAAQLDGKGKSIWDDFCTKEGKIKNNDNGNLACDSYHRYQEDVLLLKNLGVDAYRFSLSWSRILPKGRGPINEKGLTYYDNLVNLLLENNITPHITLFHWDLPLELEKEGGWLNKNTITAFRDYVQLIGKHFAGRVNHYYTINEIQIILKLGYATGEHAPGKTLTNDQIFIVAHNLLLAHGHAVSALREIDQNLKIGIASTGKLAYPKGETKSNLDTAYLTSFKVDENDWFFSHSLVLDPIVFGCYPEGLDKICPSYQDYINEGDLEIISAPLDMIGANIYNGQEVDIQGILVTRSPSFPRNSLGWPVTPKILHYGPLFLNKRYNLPIYITENGHSLLDEVGPNQRIDDSERIIFLENYLSNLKLALADKADVRGYFHWSLTDNFEWHNGYQDRFGLVFIDYQNIKRIPKDSYFWFKNYIKKEKYPC